MKQYLQVAFKNDAGDRTSIRFNDFNPELTPETAESAMDRILAAKVLTGKNGVFTIKQEAKIVTVEENPLFVNEG